MSTEGPFEWLAGGLFFGKHQKSRHVEGGIDSCKDPLVLLKGISKSLQEILSQPDQESIKQQQPENSTTTLPIAARLRRLRFLLYDERRIPNESGKWNSSTVVGSTVQVLLQEEDLNDLIPILLEKLAVLPFESRKDVAAIFNYLLVSGLDGADAAIYQPLMIQFRNHVEQHFDRIVPIILAGHDPATHNQTDVCLHYGSMYRACVRHPALYYRMVGTTESAQKYVFPFLDTLVHVTNFEVASDSMESLRAVMTAGGQQQERDNEDSQLTKIQQELAEMASTFLMRDYDEIWNKRFNAKLLSESANYMTRRVALQILSTVLLTRSNYAVMIQFVSSKTNLILIMKLLRDTSPHITLDAFHVFKVFVANPNKPPEVINILRDNKVKLSKYLATLHQEKESSDAQFREEKALIIATIQNL